MKKINLGIIGIGHWGPNLARNFFEHPGVDLKIICDTAAEKAAKVAPFQAEFTTDSSRLTCRENNLDALVIATPLTSHFKLARTALENGKHLLIEKPAAESGDEVRELAGIAERNHLIFMTGHVFLFNNAIRRVREIVQGGELGKILFIHTQRTNLGPVRRDADALWDLTTHDISIVNYLLNSRPESVSAIGGKLLHSDLCDVVRASYRYPGNVLCDFLSSWMHPCKVRQMTIVGDRKMLLWDDMQPQQPIRIYNKSITDASFPEQQDGTLSEFRFHVRDGEMIQVEVSSGEPLRSECNHFIDCVLHGTRPLSDAQNAFDVVRALEAASSSLSHASVLTPVTYE